MSPVVPPISVSIIVSLVALGGQRVDAVLDLVGDMRNHLHAVLPRYVALALIVQYRPLINLAAGRGCSCA